MNQLLQFKGKTITKQNREEYLKTLPDWMRSLMRKRPLQGQGTKKKKESGKKATWNL